MGENKKVGKIYVVATPIGNLGDISLRARQVLSDVDFIAAEDTRHSKHLLNHLNINTPCISYHEHNETERVEMLFQYLLKGESIAIISDAGTPLISDPGYALIHAAKKKGISVIPIPGPCAAIVALSASGLPTDKFIFEGFLPAKRLAREKMLMNLRVEQRTLIFYESTHRIKSSLQSMEQIFGSLRQVVIAKELTKLHETIKSAALKDLIAWLNEDEAHEKGEFVILVKGYEKQSDDTEANKNEMSHLLKLLLSELPLKKAVQLTTEFYGARKNEIYNLALNLVKTTR